MIDDILEDVKSVYGSLEKPNWSFTEKRMKKDIYRDIIEALQNIGEVSESTDLNDDYSRCLFCVIGTAEFMLKLSLVGKYACIQDGQGVFLSEQELQRDAEGQTLYNLLHSHDFQILPELDLRRKIQLGDEQKMLYEVLFSADDIL